jgi:hypothetical protein
MLNETESLATQQLRDDSAEAQKALQKKLNRIANNAAKRAGNRQQNYDGDHGIFTK